MIILLGLTLLLSNVRSQEKEMDQKGDLWLARWHKVSNNLDLEHQS